MPVVWNAGRTEGSTESPTPAAQSLRRGGPVACVLDKHPRDSGPSQISNRAFPHSCYVTVMFCCIYISVLHLSFFIKCMLAINTSVLIEWLWSPDSCSVFPLCPQSVAPGPAASASRGNL